MNRVNLISKQVVKDNLDFKSLIPMMRECMEEFSSNKSDHPRRTVIWANQERRYFIHPSYSARQNIFGTKILSIYPDCAKRGLPTNNSYLMVLDENDGALQCVLESEPLSHMRTAAASVVATQEIVKTMPKKLAILGSGNQASSHIQAFNEAYDWDQVSLWGRSKENVDALCERMQACGISVTVCKTAEEAVLGADVVVTVTRSNEPVLKGSWLKPGCHINVVGAVKANWREVDDDCVTNSVVYADSAESVSKESGDIILTKADIYAEIGEIISGAKIPKYGKWTLFKSMGLAIQDVYAAKLVLTNLRKSNEEYQSS